MKLVLIVLAGIWAMGSLLLFAALSFAASRPMPRVTLPKGGFLPEIETELASSTPGRDLPAAQPRSEIVEATALVTK